LKESDCRERDYKFKPLGEMEKDGHSRNWRNKIAT